MERGNPFNPQNNNQGPIITGMGHGSDPVLNLLQAMLTDSPLLGYIMPGSSKQGSLGSVIKKHREDHSSPALNKYEIARARELKAHEETVACLMEACMPDNIVVLDDNDGHPMKREEILLKTRQSWVVHLREEGFPENKITELIDLIGL